MSRFRRFVVFPIFNFFSFDSSVSFFFPACFVCLQINKGSYVRTEEEGKGDESVKWTWREGKLPSTGTSGGGDSKTNDDDLAFSDSEDDEDDYIDELPTIKKRTQRTAVSSGVATDLTGFIPEIVQKTIEEREKILGILSANNMFSHITNDQRQIMADAMKPKECKDEEEIIRQGDAGASVFFFLFNFFFYSFFYSFTMLYSYYVLYFLFLFLSRQIFIFSFCFYSQVMSFTFWILVLQMCGYQKIVMNQQKYLLMKKIQMHVLVN